MHPTLLFSSSIPSAVMMDCMPSAQDTAGRGPSISSMISNASRILQPAGLRMAGHSVRDETFGLASWQARPSSMAQAHRHDDIEMHFTNEAPLLYVFGGRLVQIPLGSLAAFWATLPHQLVTSTRPLIHYVTIPLLVFLRWSLPDRLVARLLRGELLVGPQETWRSDTANFAQWSVDLQSGDSELRAIAVLEIEARVRRLEREASQAATIPDAALGTNMGNLSRVVAMANFIARHFRSPISTRDIARAANVSQHYAMTIFRHAMGLTLGSYLTERRVAEAQRLLITTDTSVGEIAFAAGFGSVAQFYSCFTRTCGQPPGEYRQTYRGLRPSKNRRASRGWL